MAKEVNVILQLSRSIKFSEDFVLEGLNVLSFWFVLCSNVCVKWNLVVNFNIENSDMEYIC